ncbi:MAG: hypothetical protein JNK84_02095 [Phreatobacter sp.]|uniref:hypothetical protein n=1 Tax=Phreatobacter sp. TaxID=1966341 RepID=UPI001A3B7D54|nr:hypothetical protein [Phreatobacter sp.]MBL8567853.1 hypothetical protein [Phreatobacter sp.]
MLRRDLLKALFGLPVVAAVTAASATSAEASWLSDGVRRTGRGVNRAGRSLNRGVTRAGRSVGRGARRVRRQVFGRRRG